MTCVIPATHHNTRLDQALALLLPHVGRRGRVRCIQEGRVLLDGTPARKGQRVRAGQMLEILEPQTTAKGNAQQADLAVLAQTETFAALNKPAGMHSAALAQGSGISVEALLTQIFPDAKAVLLNRLDQPTSGIVLAGLVAGSVAVFQELENAGQVDKRYLAVLHGRLEQATHVDKGLDTNNRRTTRVLDATADPLRHTWLRPLLCWETEAGALTLVEARIHKGARHQIRAHCAHVGLPILGDGRYGPAKTPLPLHLHHWRLAMPGFSARCLPEWLAKWPGAEAALPE